LSKIIFKTKYLTNLLWIVWYDYMKICEWLLCVGYDVYHSVVYFLLTWIVRNSLILLVNTYMFIDCDMVGEYIYVDWLWYGWWIHICWLIVIWLVNTYMLIDCDIVGEYIYVNWLWYCRWMHICQVMVMLLVIAYMLNEWWWCGDDS